jgi:hypothetical protein
VIHEFVAGLPALFVLPWVAGRALLEDTLCWTTNSSELLFLLIRGPTTFSILVSKEATGFAWHIMLFCEYRNEWICHIISHYYVSIEVSTSIIPLLCVICIMGTK